MFNDPNSFEINIKYHILKKNILITGGAGFIGSHVVRLFVNKYPDYNIVNLDALTYAGNLENLKDIELAKANIENIINLGDDAVREMTEIAKQSESPRAFEVVSTLMKTLLDANKDYVEMSTKRRYAKEEDPSADKSTNVTNNNLIVSTADLLKMIKGEDK